MKAREEVYYENQLILLEVEFITGVELTDEDRDTKMAGDSSRPDFWKLMVFCQIDYALMRAEKAGIKLPPLLN